MSLELACDRRVDCSKRKGRFSGVKPTFFVRSATSIEGINSKVIALTRYFFQTEEDRPTFRPFTRESLAQIEARIQEEEEKKRELEKKRQEGEVGHYTHMCESYTNEQETPYAHHDARYYVLTPIRSIDRSSGDNDAKNRASCINFILPYLRLRAAFPSSIAQGARSQLHLLLLLCCRYIGDPVAGRPAGRPGMETHFESWRKKEETRYSIAERAEYRCGSLPTYLPPSSFLASCLLAVGRYSLISRANIKPSLPPFVARVTHVRSTLLLAQPAMYVSLERWGELDKPAG